MITPFYLRILHRLLLLEILLSTLVCVTEAFSTSTSLAPPPPWTFTASRIHYQFLSVPTGVARRVIPTTSSIGGAKENNDGLYLLSIGGKTLGGLFAIEYTDSPVGPYKEIAILAGLVTTRRHLGDVFRIGAWASHIFVDSNDAAEYARRYWGLPATVSPIDLDMPGKDEDVSQPTFVVSDDGVGVAGWTGRTSTFESEPTPSSISKFMLSQLEVTLPSYSGRLTSDDALLRYPLSVSGLGRVSIGKGATVEVRDSLRDETLRELLNMSEPLVAIDIDRARLVAGKADVLR